MQHVYRALYTNKENEERGVLGIGSIPVAMLSSCQDMKTIPL